MEQIFLTVYLLELSVKVWLLGAPFCFPTCKKTYPFIMLPTPWGAFDFFVVLVGVVTNWIAADVAALSDVMVIRVVRLLRLARAVRLFRMFRVLWLLVQGLMSVANVLFWTLLLFAMVLYLFAVAGVEMIGHDEYWSSEQLTQEAPEVVEMIFLKFGDVPKTMLTLLQFTTLDSWTAVAMDIVYRKPVLIIYFLCFIFLSSIALMNLVTATIVEKFMESSNEDREAKKAWESEKRMEIMDNLKEIFIMADEDGSGLLSLKELHELYNSSPEIQMQFEAFRVGDGAALGDFRGMERLFGICDLDGDGQLTVDEFLDGIMCYEEDAVVFLCSRIYDVVRLLLLKADNHVEEVGRQEAPPELTSSMEPNHGKAVTGSRDVNTGGSRGLTGMRPNGPPRPGDSVGPTAEEVGLSEVSSSAFPDIFRRSSTGLRGGEQAEGAEKLLESLLEGQAELRSVVEAKTTLIQQGMQKSLENQIRPLQQDLREVRKDIQLLVVTEKNTAGRMVRDGHHARNLGGVRACGMSACAGEQGQHADALPKPPAIVVEAGEV